MKSNFSRLFILTVIVVQCALLIGCKSNSDTGRGNEAMSTQQKAVIAEHKKKQEE